jgi:hypothetical protein
VHCLSPLSYSISIREGHRDTTQNHYVYWLSLQSYSISNREGHRDIGPKPLCALSVSLIILNLYSGGTQGHRDTTQNLYVHCLSLHSYLISIWEGHRDTGTQLEIILCPVSLFNYTQSLFGWDTRTQLKTNLCTVCLSNHTQFLLGWDTGTLEHNLNSQSILSVSPVILNLY